MLARQIAIGFGIAVMFPLLVYYGLATFYPPPNHADYFFAVVPPGPTASAEERKEYADRQRKAQNDYNAAARDFRVSLFSSQRHSVSPPSSSEHF